MIFSTSTYRQISLAFLMLFVSFIITPTLMVTYIDEDADISMVFALVEEETKETKEKGVLDSDEVYPKMHFPILTFNGNEITTPIASGNKDLSNLYCPGEVAPPPELS